ncbi:hypothetical protein MF271_00170 (plasmid) [Deinococcus sp. KNUC1210]|uniref:hypothetical protein n=1 Tax=Deinococcus sp. KNUC1210 TaxID=2917691 RepID=UPI001EEF8A95|nr:hypothetical protein [Deinococcus sp. KNUC1210]ULH13897.1 hypothetical protein MF271_00170 [Deinococcus sp. KNUC1210]
MTLLSPDQQLGGVFSALLEQAASLHTQAGDALAAARLAQQAGPAELARALLARSGGLYDSAEAQYLLGSSVAQQTAQPASLTPLEHEMFVRALAAALLAPAAEIRPLPAVTRSSAPLPAGLSLIDAGYGTEHWLEVCERALVTAQAAGQQHVTIACASWGAQQDALHTLRQQYGQLVGDEDQPISVLALEDVMKLLSAAWTWDLPRLHRLMSGPVVLDGLYTLAPDTMPVMLGLLHDAARVFGVCVAALHGQEYPWPDQLFSSVEPRTSVSASAAVRVERTRRPLSLQDLAARIRQQEGDSLVVLSSRASAARLAGLLRGSVLLSSSLCPLHLADQVEGLQSRRESQEPLVVVATVLPPQMLGTFQTVWHMMAPLAHLAEAAELCHGTLHIIDFSDVAPQLTWATECQLTEVLLDTGLPLTEGSTQRLYHQRRLEHRANPALVATLNRQRSELNYASLASSLIFRAGTSVPVLIEYDAGAVSLLASIRSAGFIPQTALRYAAWLTPSEAERAVQRKFARSLGWALLWEAPYHPRYGLAAEAVASVRQLD